MSDPEVLATFMEPKPQSGHTVDTDSPLGWWRAAHTFEGKHLKFDSWTVRRLTLNECHEIEAKLTDEQWPNYIHGLLSRSALGLAKFAEYRAMSIATAEQKVKALAAVLRPVVAGTRDE